MYTNQLDLTDAEILSHYRSLWQVEESFRITKHDLRIRPIYHWLPKRVRAHIAISFMAFACVRHLEHRIKIQYGKLSPETVRKELLRVQASIIRDKQTGKEYMLPSKLSTEAKHIYRVIGVKPPEQIQAILQLLQDPLQPNKIKHLSHFMLEVGSKNIIKRYGRIGRSWGCPALDEQVAKPIIDTIKDNTMLFAYFPNLKWLTKSTFLHCPNLKSDRGNNKVQR